AYMVGSLFFFSSRRRHTSFSRDWSSDVCSSDLLFSDIYAAAELQDIPAETVISEYAPGQYELTLNYRKNILQAADDLIMLKRLEIGRASCRERGWVARRGGGLKR